MPDPFRLSPFAIDPFNRRSLQHDLQIIREGTAKSVPSPNFAFAAFSAVAAPIAEHFHGTLLTTLPEMRNIQLLLRNRKAPAVLQIKNHFFALVIHVHFKKISFFEDAEP